MFNWFIDLAYLIRDIEILQINLFLIFSFTFLLLVFEYEKKIELEEKAKNYEKLKLFIKYLIRDKRDLRKHVAGYLDDNRLDKFKEEKKQEIDEFMNIF